MSFQGAGGTVVVHVSLTTVTMVTVTLATCEKSVVQFDSTKHRRFSPGTLASSCRNSGPMKCVPYWTSRVNSLANRVIQYKKRYFTLSRIFRQFPAPLLILIVAFNANSAV